MSRHGVEFGIMVCANLAIAAFPISTIVCAIANDASFATCLKTGFSTCAGGAVGAIGFGMLAKDSSKATVILPLLGYAFGAVAGYNVMDKAPVAAPQHVSTLPQSTTGGRGLAVVIGDRRLTL